MIYTYSLFLENNNRGLSFIKKSKEVHDNFYNYDNVIYKNARTKVLITCPNHGDFWQLPYNHLLGKGCNKCSVDKNKILFTKSRGKFIDDSISIHGNKFNYDKVDYKNDGTDVIINCPKHGDFLQKPNHHLQGQMCPLCRKEDIYQNYTKKYSDLFVKRSKEIHNNYYDYSKSIYINNKTILTITCPKHGDFLQKASNHLNGRGCPRCNQSQGEKKIESFLIRHKL